MRIKLIMNMLFTNTNSLIDIKIIVVNRSFSAEPIDLFSPFSKPPCNTLIKRCVVADTETQGI